MERVRADSSPTELRKHLFYETSHSPSLADLVGYEKAKDIIDFCFIANPYYPTREMLEDLKENFPNLIKSYPSSSSITSQSNLAAVLHVNPGNPTGQLFSLDEMIEFLERAKDMELVIVDESFIDFAGDTIPSLLQVAEQFSNFLLVRSMSKHCGVPGLRLGYCYSGNLYVLNRMRQYIPTWNVNTLAQYFLSLLPSTNAAYHESRKRLIGDVRWLYNALRAIAGIEVYPTGANFVLFKIKGGMTAAELQGLLLTEHGMYVRDCSNKIGMDTFHIRVASQGREKDSKLVEALEILLR